MFHKKVVEKIITHIFYSITFSENCAVCEIMWKNMGRARQTTDYNIIQRMYFACWITKATDTLRTFNNYGFSMAKMVT
jgi:hypothetical protein